MDVLRRMRHGAAVGLAAILAAALALPLSYSFARARTPLDQAKRAVRHEVQNRFPGAREINVYSCKRLTARRFKCGWDASAQRGQSDGKHGFASGDARATVYRYGADARLLNIKCYSGTDPIVSADFCA